MMSIKKLMGQLEVTLPKDTLEPCAVVAQDINTACAISQANSLKRIADELGCIRTTLDNLLINYANRR